MNGKVVSIDADPGLVELLVGFLREAQDGTLQALAFVKVSADGDPSVGWHHNGDPHALAAGVADLAHLMGHRRLQLAGIIAPDDDDPIA